MEGFCVEHSARPEPGPGQIRVRTLAASVQYTDVIIRKGVYPDLKDKPPLVLGYDIVGEIEALGPDVEGWTVGERVADLTMIGSYAQTRLLEADRVVRVPPSLDPAKVATLVLSWVTAHQLLHRSAEVRAGQTVLVHGAAGAVGQALLQLGRLAGLTMYGTCRASDADLLESFGATPIDRHRESPADVVPNGFDVVFDGIGQDGFIHSWRLLKPGGILSFYGMSAAVQSDASSIKALYWFMRPFLWNALPNGKRARFYSITAERKRHPDRFRDDLSTLVQMLDAGEIEPRVGERIGFEQIPQTHQKLEKGGVRGKIVLVPG